MNREKKIIQTSFVGIGANLGLVALKLVVGILAGAISLILDAVNNLTDALSSLLTAIGAKLAGKRPDKKHPFGYGRIEYLTSTIIAGIILFAGAASIVESIQTLIDGNPLPNYTDLSLILISVGILVKVLLGLYFRKVGKSVSSSALSASGADALFDSIISLSTLVGAIVARYAGIAIEPYLGILIGLFILKSGIGILIESLSAIVGERSEEDLNVAIKDIVTSKEGVKGAYDLIIHSYGPNKAIGSVHIEVDDDVSAKQIHALTREITQEVYLKHHVVLTLGIYASNDQDPTSGKIKNDLFKIIASHTEVIQTHGFYVDEGSKVITFDLVIDLSCKEPEKVAHAIKDEIAAAYPQYTFYPVIDVDYAV